MRLAILVPLARPQIVEKMQVAAKDAASKLDGVSFSVVKVSGLLEAPPIAKMILERGIADGVAILGAIIKDNSDHHFIIGATVCDAIAKVAFECGKPITLGFVGPASSIENAMKEAPAFAERAVNAAYRTYKLIEKIASASELKDIEYSNEKGYQI